MPTAISSTNAADAQIANTRATLVDSYDTFLTLLTAQLKNQDPTSPVDTNEFTAQLVQMSGVEQQLLTNDLLTDLINQNEGGLTSAVSYIGKDVVAVGSATSLKDGAATWSYELAADANAVNLEVVNSQGQVVWSGPATERGQGIHDFTWDGRSTGGVNQAPGVYSLRVAATNTSGQSLESQVLLRGRVSAVELYAGEPYATVGGSILPLSSIISVVQPTATTSN